MPKIVLGVIAAAALGAAIAIWVTDGSGGQATTTTTTGPSTTQTTTTGATVLATTTPTTVKTTSTPGRPARSSELTLVVLLLGVGLVFGLASISKGRITRLDFPGGGGFQLGTAAQAQVSGRIAAQFTDSSRAQAAYTQAVALLKEREGESKVDFLPPDTVEQVVSEASSEIASHE